MALAQRGAYLSGGGSGTSAAPGSLPAGVTTGDIIYFAVIIAGFDANATVGTPSGYTQLGTTLDGFFGNLYMYRKVAGSSESAPSASWSGTNDYRWFLWAVSGADTTTPEAGTNQVVDDSFSATTAIPVVDADGATCFSYVVHAMEGSGDLTSWPTGWSTAVEEHAGEFTNRCHLGANESPGTGNVGGGNVTTSTRAKGLFHILVQESTGGGATTRRYSLSLTGVG